MIQHVKKAWAWFRQPVSGLSHLTGAILAVFGMIWLLIRLSSYPVGHGLTENKFISVLIFCLSMTFLYAASSLYHLLPLSQKGIQRLRKLDHAAIYIFIAGSYTPVGLILLREGKGPTIVFWAWVIAALGVFLKLFWIESSRWIRVGIYTSMSLMSVVILPEICTQLSIGGLIWLFGGIGAYTLGALIYAMKWPDPLPEVVGFHEIWHVFVMLGGFCHFWLLKEYLIVI